MILVLGATGTTGGEVAKQLIAAGQKPRILVRSRAKASAFEGKAEIVEGDLENPESVAKALVGVDKLFLVSAGLNGPKLEVLAIQAAKKAGVRHIVKLSVIGADNPQIAFAKWHAGTEQVLKESGVAWTMVRPGNFNSNAFGWADTIKSQGAFYQPTANGRWASIDPADIGAVAVKALLEPGHEGKAYTLTGPESMSAADYADKLSKVLGKPVKFVDVPAEAAQDAMLKSGMPAGYVDALLELLGIMKANFADVVTTDVEKVLGRKGTAFEAWAAKNAAAFR